MVLERTRGGYLRSLFQSGRLKPKEVLIGVVAAFLAVLSIHGLYRMRWKASRPRATQFSTVVSGDAMDVPVRLSGEELLSRSFAKRIIVSEKNRFVYCPVPKVANSNWKYLVRKLEGFDDYMDLPKSHKQETSGLRYLSDYSPEEVEHILYRSGYHKFVFVRDPYTRLLSCYVDKFLNKNATRDEYKVWLGQLYDFKRVRESDLTNAPRPSFRAFIDEVLKQDADQMNEHWMPQAYVCGFGEVPYDFVGRFESLEEDSRKTLDRLGFPGEHFPTQDEIGFAATGSSKLVGEIYTLDTMLKARIVYDVDFSILGY